MKFRTIINDVRHIRDQECAEYRKEFPKGRLFNRGTFIGVMVEMPDGKKAQAYEGEVRSWNGTLKDLQAAIDEALSSKGASKVVSVFLYGGYDWAEDKDDYDAGNYEPRVVEWEYEVIKKEVPDACAAA